MQTLKSEMNWAGPFDVKNSRDYRNTVDKDQWAAGWWLLPSIIGGAAFWTWAISAILT